MCGVIGLFGQQNIVSELFTGLNSLQHRGHDSAGIVTLDHTFHLKKGAGTVNTVFAQTNIEELTGNLGLGHVRYATQGQASIQNAQPFTVNYPFGIALAHNGNLTNFDTLKTSLINNHHRLINSSNDVELMLYTIVLELEKKNLNALDSKDIFSAITQAQKHFEGGYATVGLIAQHGLFGFVDPHNIRPLVVGEKKSSSGTSYILASETTTLDYLGYNHTYTLKEGEIVFIDQNKEVNIHQGLKRKKSFCVFEHVYFAREDSIIDERLVADQRQRLGAGLAKQFQALSLKPDIVIDVPSSSYFCALGLAKSLNIPYKRALIKNSHIGRSFITATQSLREKIVRQKLNPIRSYIKGKKIVVVDDSIVRGTTSKHIVKILKDKGAQAVYFVSSSPPIKHPCLYGIDLSKKKEMIASYNSTEKVREYIGAEALIYPSLEQLRSIFPYDKFCDACFSGNYPTFVDNRLLNKMENEKLASNR